MTVYKKLQAARVEMAHKPLKKSGKNKFAGYEYFELGDFLPTAHEVFSNHGLCGVFSIDSESATLCVHDVDSDGAIRFTAPTVMAHNPKGQPIQDLGGTLTYFRRYLWMIALELTEGDTVDAAEPVKREVDPKTGEIKPPAKIEGKGGEWNIKITAKEGASAQEWATTVYDAAMIALNAAQSLNDVMSIFRVNRAIFDRLRADSEPTYTDLMTQFKLSKESFNAIP